MDSFRLIGKFLAEAADTGERFEVSEFQEFKSVTTKDGTDWIPGMKELRLNSGARVTYHDEDTFEIPVTGTILKRVRA